MDDDAPVQLRSDTLAALQEVLREKAAAVEAAAHDASDGRIGLATTEDWQMVSRRRCMRARDRALQQHTRVLVSHVHATDIIRLCSRNSGTLKRQAAR